MTSRVLICNTSLIPDSDLLSALHSDQDNSVTFDNKYFTVTVQICLDKEVPIEELSDTVEAFVYVVEEPKDGVTEVIEKLERVFKEFLEEQAPAVKLLLINSESSKFEEEFLEWCVENEFEFIKYITTDNNAEEGLMGQSEGMGRVRSALECHLWPYRTMKSSNSTHTEQSEEFGEFVTANGALADFQSLMEGGELEGDFESMFSNMMKIKEVAGQLPDDQRKQFAEQVALSFWRALGGSDDELE